MLAAAKNALRVSTLAIAAAALPGTAAAADFTLVPYWPVVAANVVLFLVLIVPVNRLMVQPLLRQLEERDEKTHGALERATALEGRARETTQQIEARLKDARAEAQARRAAILAEAEREERALLQAAAADAARSIESVRTSVQADLAEARGALEADARSLAREVASRLLARPL